MNKLIAIVGMAGSGKSVACDFFEKKGFEKVYFGGITMEKLKNENLPITPENEKMMRNRLRQEYGMSAYAILSLPKIKEKLKNNNVVIDGLYSWDELLILQKEFENLKTIAIIVDKNIRYDRISNRKERAFNRQEIINRDLSEIENLAKAQPIAYADYYVFNNGSVEEYQKRLEQLVEVI